MSRSERWIVRHDSAPRAIEFGYPTEEQAREAYDRGAFYDPATGWGVTLLRRVTEVEVLDTTKPARWAL